MGGQLRSLARAGAKAQARGRRVRDDLRVDAHADAEDADAVAHVGALPVVAGTLAITAVIGSVARRRRQDAVCLSPARAWELV